MPDRLHVQPEKCSSCIFGPNSPVSPERFADLRAQWERKGNERFQICHQTATGYVDEDGDWIEDENEEGVPGVETLSVCRGWYDEFYVRRGTPVPGVETLSVCRGWYDEFYVRRGTPVQIIQVAERLGLLDTEGEMRGTPIA